MAQSHHRQAALMADPAGERDRRRLRYGLPPRSCAAGWVSAWSVAENVIHGDVDRDAPQAHLVAQGGGDLPLDITGYLMDGIAIRNRHGQVHDRGTAQHPTAACG